MRFRNSAWHWSTQILAFITLIKQALGQDQIHKMILQLMNGEIYLLWYIQSSVVITPPNITRYCIHHCRNWGRVSSRGWTHKRPTIPRLSSPASYGISFVNIFDKIDRVITTPHCICICICIYVYVYVYIYIHIYIYILQVAKRAHYFRTNK